MSHGFVVRRNKVGKALLAIRDLREMAALPQAIKSVDQAKTEQDAAVYLTSLKQPFYVPPTALGSKRASMPHRFHAVCHAVRLVSSTWEGCCQLISSQFSLVSDLGTERLVPRFPRVPIWRLFPWAGPLAPVPAAAAAAAADPAADPALGLRIEDDAACASDASGDVHADNASAADSSDQESTTDGSSSSSDHAGSDSDDWDDVAVQGGDEVDLSRVHHVSGPLSYRAQCNQRPFEGNGWMDRFRRRTEPCLQTAEPAMESRPIL